MLRLTLLATLGMLLTATNAQLLLLQDRTLRNYIRGNFSKKYSLDVSDEHSISVRYNYSMVNSNSNSYLSNRKL